MGASSGSMGARGHSSKPHRTGEARRAQSAQVLRFNIATVVHEIIVRRFADRSEASRFETMRLGPNRPQGQRVGQTSQQALLPLLLSS